MAVDVGKNISGFLSSKQVGASSELASEWAALDELHTKKWVLKFCVSYNLKENQCNDRRAVCQATNNDLRKNIY